jgi:hypothetical protein
MPYADRTTVPVERTEAEIEQTLTRYGADRFAYFVEPKGAVIIFEAHGRRRYRKGLTPRWNAPASSVGAPCCLCIKAKLESVASNIEAFEQAFRAM